MVRSKVISGHVIRHVDCPPRFPAERRLAEKRRHGGDDEVVNLKGIGGRMGNRRKGVLCKEKDERRRRAWSEE